MRKSKIKQITLAVCLSLMPLAALSAGLGKLNVTSGLGEPLKAEIELLSVSPEELSTLVAAIASDEAYNAQGISRLAIHNNIKVEVTKSATGSPIIKIRSSQPINDPYLDMLIQVDWASGRLQREYTVLLDPPGYKPSEAPSIPMQITAPVVNAPVEKIPEPTVSAPQSEVAAPAVGTASVSADVTTEPIKEVQQVEAKKAETQPAEVTKPEPIQAQSVTDSITTQRGDTLNAIAKQMQVEGVSLDQMLVGLYENNKSAFSGGNMNRLKVGQIIKLPSKEELTSTSEKQAAKSVRAQSANWNEYRNNLAGVVAELPATEELAQKQSASGKIVTTEDKAVAPKAGPQDVVKLSAGEKDKQKAGKDSNKEFEAKIVALQEETTAREKALKEAQERTSALEKQIQDMRKLLALKSQNMAKVQSNAEIQKKADEAAKLAATTATKPTADAVTTPAPSTEATENTTLATTSVPEATPPVVEKSPEVVKPAVVKPPVKPAAVTPPATVEDELSLLDTLAGFIDTTILAAIAIVGLLGAGWMFLRNKRRKDLDSFERGILTSGGLRANTVFGNTTGSTSNSDTSFLTDFAQSADGSMIDTNDVDPIAEAEVYMAYGRDAQAEEILKDAITKEPKRYELHLKLLEMYANRKETSAFEAIAGELYTTLGSDDPTWAKVAVIGAAMEPENPLYDVSKISTAASTQLETQKLDSSDFDNVDVASDLDLDFSAGAEEPEDANSAVMQSFSSAEKVDQEVSFDMGSLDMDSNEVESLADSSAANLDISADNSMDFDLGDFGAKAEETIIMNKPLEVGAPDLNVLDTMDNLSAFDMPEAKNEFEAPAFDLPAMDMSTSPVDVDGSVSKQLEEDSSNNEFSMDFELPSELTGDVTKQETAVEEVSFDLGSLEIPESEEASAPSADSIDDFSFDLPIADDVTTSEASLEVTENTSQPSANEFDLSTISLDLGDSISASEDIGLGSSDGSTSSSNMASEDVDIKLDLVAAYIDMDDKEGARELLEEIINEGGVKQQVRAKQLLDSLA